MDGIHGTPYIAAPWIRHGLWDTYNQTIYGKDDLPYMKWKKYICSKPPSRLKGITLADLRYKSMSTRFINKKVYGDNLFNLMWAIHAGRRAIMTQAHGEKNLYFGVGGNSPQVLPMLDGCLNL